jgi:ATP-dependent Lhr-like helicase
VLVDGVAALYLERGGSTLQTLAPADDPAIAAIAMRSLATLVTSGRTRELVIRKIDGLPVGESPWHEALTAGGFSPGYRGLTIRGSR